MTGNWNPNHPGQLDDEEIKEIHEEVLNATHGLEVLMDEIDAMNHSELYIECVPYTRKEVVF